MRSFSIILCLLFSITSTAQTIAEARAMGVGATVTVNGIVTNGEELGDIRYIEDATAGIGIYEPAIMNSVERGDSITVTGELVDFYGLLEIQPVNNLTTHNNGYSITPQLITPSEMGEDTEGELVRINNLIFDNGGGIFSSGTHGFVANGEAGVIYIKNGSPLVGELIPVEEIGLIGISSQYTFTGFGGYQLLPRDINDFIFSDGVLITSPLTQSNISTTSFDISWNTSMYASSECFYGLTSALELGLLSESTNTSEHVLNINNLTPGNIYYVMAFSVANGDTAFSNLSVFATASLSSGTMKAYFNQSVDNSVATIENAQNISVFFNDTIKAYLDRANESIDIAIYNHSDALITTAINDAYERGVQIRYISCGTTASTAIGDFNNNIPTLERPDDGSGLMHNKFVIIDANNADSSWVISGGTNWTNNQLFDDFNNLILIQDQSLAKAYEIEFEEMWGSNSLIPDQLNAKFGPNKSDNTPHEFLINGKRVELYFSPSDQTTNKIITAIESTDNDAHFGTLVFTKNELAWALEDVFNNDSEVTGIIEQINTQGSEYEYLLDLGIDVRSHMGVSGQFHHKYCVIDQAETTSDPLVITGSHNWSSAAENKNDENTLIIHDANIANQYYQEYIERFNELSQATLASWNCVSDACIDPGDGSGTFNSLASCVASCTSSIEECEIEKGKLLYITDALGRKTAAKKGEVQFYIYQNGTVKKQLQLKP